MNKITKITTTIAIALLLSVGVKAQKNYNVEAGKAFSSMEYYNAIELYKKAYEKAKNKGDKARIIFMTAECYRLIGDNKQAEQWYTKAIKANYTDTKAIYYLANAKKAQEKYNEALIEYKKYQKANPSDKRGDDGAKSCELAQQWKDHPTRYHVENMVQINSKEPDFAPCYADKKFNKLYFTSMRAGGTGSSEDPTIGQNYSDIFETSMDKNGKWSTPVSMSGGVNTKDNEGNCAVTKKGDKIFFSRCLTDSKKVTYNKIYVATKKGNSWGDGELLPFCNNDTIKYAAPSISSDGTTLFFCSNMPGGQGGNDIWYSKYDKKNNKWGDPVNLGPDINTPGEEVWPFLHDDGTLYFSSDGHLGMGGLDIFKAEKKGDDKWGNVTNLKYPINSAADDFAIIFEGKKERGYFSSNREGTKGKDDIWSFALPPLLFVIEGVVTDCKFKETIPGVTIKLVGSDGSSVETKTDAAGYYKFAENGQDRFVNPGTSYVITTSVGAEVKTVQAPLGFLNSSDKAKETTVGEELAKTFKHDFCLIPIEKEIRFPDVLYDLGKFDLRPESKDSLDFLYQTLIDNPNLVIELSSHTDYRDHKINQVLSENRAKACVEYLISKGIPAERMVPKGYAESRPVVIEDTTHKAPSGKILAKGSVLSPKWIDTNFPEKKNKEDYEYVMQLNRRTVFSVLRKDYVNPNAPKEEIKKEKKEDDDE